MGGSCQEVTRPQGSEESSQIDRLMSPRTKVPPNAETVLTETSCWSPACARNYGCLLSRTTAHHAVKQTVLYPLYTNKETESPGQHGSRKQFEPQPPRLTAVSPFPDVLSTTSSPRLGRQDGTGLGIKEWMGDNLW